MNLPPPFLPTNNSQRSIDSREEGWESKPSVSSSPPHRDDVSAIIGALQRKGRPSYVRYNQAMFLLSCENCHVLSVECVPVLEKTNIETITAAPSRAHSSFLRLNEPLVALKRGRTWHTHRNTDCCNQLTL